MKNLLGGAGSFLFFNYQYKINMLSICHCLGEREGLGCFTDDWPDQSNSSSAALGPWVLSCLPPPGTVLSLMTLMSTTARNCPVLGYTHVYHCQGLACPWGHSCPPLPGTVLSLGTLMAEWLHSWMYSMWYNGRVVA